MKNFATIIVLFIFGSAFAQKSYDHIAFINATAHIGNGKVIETSIVVINKNKIEMVSDVKGIKLNPRVYDTVIDISGKHIYPALINCNNILGLHDAEAVRATRDFAEVGQLNPHIRALIAYNTDNLIVPTIKTNGILYTQCTPRGGLISGSSSIMALEGWNWEDAVLKADDGIHLNFPRMQERHREQEGENAQPAGKRYQDDMTCLDKFFTDAKSYLLQANPAEKNIRFEAMRQVFNGKANLYIHCDKARDIISAINFCQKHDIKKPVIVGGKESYKVTKDLKKYKVPVMLNRVHDLPDRNDESVDISYSIAGMLQKDSILFCLQVEGDMEAIQSRNLAFNAGTTVAYGMTKEQALQSITLNAAKILGVDNQLGSLEEGKLSSIVISNGDILDMRTNNIVMAYIAGKPVNLNNKQTELYQKYKAKYGIK